MSILTGLDDLVLGRLAAIQVSKNSGTSVTGFEHSYWLQGGMPAAGANPPASGAGATTIPDRTTLGALPIPGVVNPAQLYLGVLNLMGSALGTVILRDRLAHVAGLSGIVITAQPTVHNALTRYTTGDGVQGYIEVYATLGATAATATVSYTNQAGVAGRVGTASIPANAGVTRMFPIILQAGDTGIQSIQSVTLSVSTGTAGNFGITLGKTISQVGILFASASVDRDAISLGAPEILNGACLMLSAICSTTTLPSLFAFLGLVQK